MLTPAQRAEWSRAAQDVDDIIVAEVRAALRGAAPTAAAFEAALLAVMPEVVQRFGDVAAMLAALYYNTSRAAAGVGKWFEAEPINTVTARQVASRVKWSLYPIRSAEMRGRIVEDAVIEQARQLAEAQMQKTARQSGRVTVVTATSNDPAKPRFRRVPRSDCRCGFCLMLASRGAVYLSADTAAGFHYHGGCHCVAEAVFLGDQEPPEVSGLLQWYYDTTNGASGAPAVRALNRAAYALEQGD